MKQRANKVLAILLSVLMLASVVPSAVLAAGVDYNHNASVSTDEYYNLISKSDWDNAPGIVESEIVLNNDAGDDRQVLYIMKADVNNSYVSVIPTYAEMNTSKYQTATMLDQANWIDQNMDGEVIGVMNCCLSWYTGYDASRVGEPLGFMMLNGEIMFDPGNCGYAYGNVGFPTCVVINKDYNDAGEARPSDIPKLEMVQIRTSADLDGWEYTVIPVSSGYIVKDGVNQYSVNHADEAPRSVVGITADGQVVMMLNDGRQAPFSAGMSMYELAEVMIAAGCVWAANCDGGGSSTYVSQRPGEDLQVNNSPSDGGLRPSTSGICFISTAPADGQFYKAHITSEGEYYTPGSTVQFTAVGTDMAGNKVDIPAEATWQLADTSYGTISDGKFVSNGNVGVVTAQLVYNDEVVGEASLTIVYPEIAFKNETIVIGYGDSMSLPVSVTTNNGQNEVIYDSDDIIYTLSDSALGTVSNGIFTACDESTGLTNGTVTATVCGQTEKTVTATIKFGKASEIVYDFEDGELPIDTSNTGNIGGDDAEDTGEYIYGWHISDTRQNGYYSYRYYAKKNYTPIGMDIPAGLRLVDSTTGRVRNGNYAMAVDIDWTNVTASCHGQMDIFLPESLDLTDATNVGFWMYIPSEIVIDSMNIRFGFRTTDGGSTTAEGKFAQMLTSTTGIDNGGWYYIGFDVQDNYATFEYIQLNSHYTAGEGNYNYYQDVTYYIDDITVDYSDATIDRENPYFSSIMITDENGNGTEIAGQTITTNTINLMAQAYENTTKANATGLDRNSVKLYIDGVLSNAAISTSLAGAITVTDLYLNDGVHTILMEISDAQGNVGNIVRKLVVNTENSGVRLEVPTTDSLIPTGSIYWVNLVADDLASIDSVTTTINLDYVNDWELQGMEVAYGFKAEYYINDHNDAVLTFTRTGTEIADTTVLAKLPIRIWMAKGWMDDSGIRADYISNDPAKQDKYYILTPHAMWYSDGTRDYRLVVSAEAGLITYTDGTTNTFSAIETVLQTEMNRYYTNSDRQGKWSFHICTAGEAQSKDATCTENGYIGRTFCTACACGSVDNLGTECDTHNGCGSVIDWGTIVPATGHTYEIIDGKLACACGELFNGEYTDGKIYIDGVIADGWVAVDGVDTYYYVDGKMVTGSIVIDRVVYTFDENGVYLSGNAFNGFIETAEGVMYFYANTNYEEEYIYVNDTAYYFEDGIAKDGEYVINGETCVFVDGVYASCSTADVIDAGWQGTNVTYILYSNGSFILGGEGATYKYTSRASLPWQTYKKQIKSIFVGKEITVLDQFALAETYNAKTITFEEDSKLHTIGAATFLSNYAVEEIAFPESLEYLNQNSFKMCTALSNVIIPQNIKNISFHAFVNNSNVIMDNIALSVVEGTVGHEFAVKYNVPFTFYTVEKKAIASGTCGTNATWNLYNDGELVIGGSGAIDTYTSKEQQPWAAYTSQIKSVVIGKDITAIGNYAFAYCYYIENVTFEEGSILESVGAVAFHYALNLKSVTLPETVKSIGTLAFGYSSKLTYVYIPQDITNIVAGAFTNTSNVVLAVAKGTYSEEYAAANGISYTTRDYVYAIIASGACGTNATWELYNSGELIISGSGAIDTYTGKEQQPWGAYANQIKSVVIGKDITAIGNYAFAYCYFIESVTFEEGSVLESVGAVAFHYALNLKSVTLPETVTYIGTLAFGYSSKLTYVYIPQGIKTIVSGAFTRSTNVKLYVAEGTIGETFAINNSIAYDARAYVYEVIASGTCGENATWTLYNSGELVIGGTGAMATYTDKAEQPWAAYTSQIKAVTIGKDITAIGNYAFAYCYYIESVTFEEGSALESVGAVAFHYALHLVTVELPETVTYIGNLAFGYSSRLTTVTIPEGATVHANAFLGSSNVNVG